MKKTRKNGFTLVEIMIVVLIIGLLAAIAVPGFARARADARSKTCINNLRLIEAAKDQAAMALGLEEAAGEGDFIGEPEYLEQFKGDTQPSCPIASASYTVGAIGATPTCSEGNAANNYHALPQ